MQGYDRNKLNPSTTEAELLRGNYVNTIAATGMVPWFARWSVTIPLIMQGKRVLVSHGEGFQLPARTLSVLKIDRNENTFTPFPEINPAQQSLR